eukprot:CAMPEP_0116877854 /NCGR_PEP_ID=MMETSP0463-20121206/9589_1 /TAXON_ID=181622 /ORGANISM="Strombidinopsis sp, Strain SopsisLIS2011" /LENGTH=61 /DNA_ID=CAMNT_0004525461 /DNA_START=929 /DNA_END=1114 /DNA_ORIENTATION=+
MEDVEKIQTNQEDSQMQQIQEINESITKHEKDVSVAEPTSPSPLAIIRREKSLVLDENNEE